jgi:hypothetical protein
VDIRSIAGAGLALAVLAAAPPPARAQVKAGAELRANSYTTGAQLTPGIAMQASGDFIVTWRSAGQDGSGYGIFGQRFARDGSARGGEFRVNTTTGGNQFFSEVAIGRNGQFVVAWRSPDGDYDGIAAQLFDALGNKVGGELQVNTNTVGFQYLPDVAIDGRGNFVVVWTDIYADGDLNYGVKAQRFDSAGNRLGGEFEVNTTTGGNQGTPEVAAAADGRFVVVWQSEGQDGSDYGIVGQLFDASGARAGGELQVNTYTPNGQIFPSVAMTPDGRFVVGWASDQGGTADGDVRAQRFSAAGARLGAEFAVNTYTTDGQFPYSIAVDHQGNYVLAWDDGDRDGSNFGAFGWRIGRDDTRRGSEFQANTYTTEYQGLTQVAGDAVGNFIVAWHSDQDPGGGSRGVYLQRYGGLFPAALGVDTTGNRVWEAGETVDVRPTWSNLNGASQAIAATLASLTGPAGATYTIVDGAGDYGTMANGADVPCSNCYSVMVDAPASRPLHWDATALERLSPDTQGQQKGWALHIGGSFTDVAAGNPFYRFVEALLHHSVTGGCGGASYCPGNTTTREQMAVFVLVAKEGAGYAPPACTTPVFADVPASSPFCPWIEELARRGVVFGCASNLYCPGDPTTREQMSAFVLRTLDPALAPPPCGTPVFADVPAGSPFCRWIEELARRGVVTGCAPGLYCPTAPVTREQMGVFIGLTFGLTLYGV